MRGRIHILLLVIAIAGCLFSTAFAYQNPLVEGPDPCVVKWMGKYYLYATGNHLYTSDDLVNWAYQGSFASSAPGLWAPEVFYYNGTFYAYLSSSAFQCRIATSSSPAGPFQTVTMDAGVNSIDFDVFLDDDGQLYMSYAAHGGCKYQTMSSPLSIDGPVNQWSSCTWLDPAVVPAGLGTWNEAPHVMKIANTYYLTFSGGVGWDHPSYQIHAGRGASLSIIEHTVDYAGVLVTYDVYETTTYPMISDLESPWYATGHQYVTLGPDLKTYYIVYHAYNGGSGSSRRIMVDRIWVDPITGNLATNAPTYTPQPAPALPDWSDAFDRDSVGPEWSGEGGGTWSMHDGQLMRGDSRGQASWARQVMAMETGGSVVAEFNLRLREMGTTSANPKCGVFVGYESGSSGFYVFFDETNNRLASYGETDGVDAGWVNSATLPEDWDHRKWHTLRIVKKGTTFEVFLDEMLRITRTLKTSGGRVGFVVEDCQADFGWTAFSNCPECVDPNDLDGDGLCNDIELAFGTDPENWDSDGDGLSDYFEAGYDGNPSTLDVYHATVNPEGRDLDPLNPDTDGDGVEDGTEIRWGYDPLDPTSFPVLPAISKIGCACLVLMFILLAGAVFVQAEHLKRAGNTHCH